jgi:sugar phosphate isomerase/epimerase
MPADPIAHLAIQSWCFRAFKDNAEVIKHLKTTGVSDIELCGVHCDSRGADSQKVIDQYKAAGVGIVAFGVEWFDADESRSRKLFDFAKRAGLKTLSADIDPENDAAIKVTEKLAAEYGVTVGIHNHGRKHRLGPVWALEKLFAKTTKNIGLHLDTAWMLDAGEDAVEVAKKFRDRLHGLHIKDFTFNRDGTVNDVVAGTGVLKLDALAKLLVETNFTGAVTIEYEGEEKAPVPSLTQCVKNIRASFAKAGGAKAGAR